MKSKLKIVFFGSGDFPVLSLKMLLSDKSLFEVVGVVSSKDKQYIFKESISNIAIQNNIPLIIPEDVNSSETVKFLKDLHPDIFCVMSYKKLSHEILSIPTIASFNVHASLLPLLRGAAPIQWALRFGLKKTGLTSFLLTDKIDAGPIICNKVIDIKEEDNYGSLLKKMCVESVDVVRRSLTKLSKDDYLLNVIDQPYFESNFELFKAPKINSSNNIIVWDEFDSEKIINYLKSVYPYNGVPAKLYVTKQIDESMAEIIDKIDLKIYNGHIVHDFPPHMIDYFDEINQLSDLNFFKGDRHTIYSFCNIVTDFKKHMYIKTEDKKLIEIDELQISGKKVMKTPDFLHGFKHCRDKENIFILNEMDV